MSELSQSYDPAQHELLVSGTADAFEYELALRNVVYRNAASQPTAGVRQ